MEDRRQPQAEALAAYVELLRKIDAKVSEIRSRHPSAFSCARRCHGCCAPGLTVSALEAESIREYLSRDGIASNAAQTLAETRPHARARCGFLTAEGDCSIYEARPIVCRSHGAPIVTPDGERDVCPLNFDGIRLDELPAVDLLNAETVNVLLALLNRRYDATRALERVALDPTSFVPQKRS